MDLPEGFDRDRSLAAFVSLHQGDVGVLERGPAHLEILDVGMGVEQLPYERGGLGAGVGEPLSVAGPADLASRFTWRASSSALPSATIRPAARIRIRSASFSASARSWVVRRIVVSSRSARRLTRSWNSRRACGSKPAVGSSRKRSSGRPTMPTATSSRRRWPPDRSRIFWFACSVRPTSRINSSTSYGRERSGVEYGM